MANRDCYILGINGGVRLGYQDVSAALLKNGRIAAAVEEERLNRIKHSPGQLPELSVREVLDLEGITLRDISGVASHGSTWGDEYENVLKDYLSCRFGFSPPVKRYHHHLCHAASAYFASGYDEALVLTTDASGDGDSLHAYTGENGKLKLLDKEPRGNSLGIFYSMMTQFCGFTRDTDEYKLMGLAPYGTPGRVDTSDIVKVSGGRYTVNKKYFKQAEPGQGQPSRQQAVYTRSLIDLLGAPRMPGAPLTGLYKDTAAAAQETLEKALLALLERYCRKTGLSSICMAGGVALNCAANRMILKQDWAEKLFVQPAAGDSGLSLGAAYLMSAEEGFKPEIMSTACLGSSYDNREIEQVLQGCGVRYRESSDTSEEAASMIADNKVIGWFQGRSEYGPRALGSRSILGNALAPEMKELINSKIKFREGFRPFCPAVLEEDFDEFFRGKKKSSPFMTINYDVISRKIPAVTHIDSTARIQTVSRDENPLFHRLLCILKENTGYGVCVNTSFNRSREPIVNSPRDALSVFYGSGLDSLVIGDFIVEK